jgi:hypothetical protein
VVGSRGRNVAGSPDITGVIYYYVSMYYSRMLHSRLMYVTLVENRPLVQTFSLGSNLELGLNATHPMTSAEAIIETELPSS